MKKYITVVVSLLITASLAGLGCGGSSGDSSFFFLTANGTKAWRFVSATRNGQPFDITDCLADELLVFNTDGTGFLLFGETDCNPESTLNNDFFNWAFFNDNQSISSTGHHEIGGTNEELDIVELTENRFVYTDVEMRDGVEEISTYTLEPAVMNIDPSIPFALANGHSKLWKFSSVSAGGTDIPISECQSDELVLYNADGTGHFVFGETDCDPGETVESDFFRYSISEDGGTVIGTELNSPDGDTETLTVLDLTDSIFRYSSMEPGPDGTEIELVITLVPYLE